MRCDTAKKPGRRTPDPELLRKREKAGERYAAAVQELISCLVDLAAVEGAIGAESVPEHERSFYTFAAHQPDTLPDLRHRAFVPQLPKSIRALVEARSDQLTNAPAA